VKSIQEFFRRLEREVRTPREVLPIDAFLPSPETLPTEFPDSTPSPRPPPARARGSGAEADGERRERRKQRRSRKARSAGAAAEPPRKLEEEVQEFLNRDRPAGSRSEEISEFIDNVDLTGDTQEE